MFCRVRIVTLRKWNVVKNLLVARSPMLTKKSSAHTARLIKNDAIAENISPVRRLGMETNGEKEKER